MPPSVYASASEKSHPQRSPAAAAPRGSARCRSRSRRRRTASRARDRRRTRVKLLTCAMSSACGPMTTPSTSSSTTTGMNRPRAPTTVDTVPATAAVATIARNEPASTVNTSVVSTANTELREPNRPAGEPESPGLDDYRSLSSRHESKASSRSRSCVITRTPRPSSWARLASVASSAAAPAGSRCVVGSSKIRKRASLEQQAGGGDPLPLAAGDLRAGLADVGVEPVGQRGEPRAETDAVEGGGDRRVIRVGPGECDVVTKRHSEQVGVLRGDPNDRPQRVGVEVTEIGSRRASPFRRPGPGTGRGARPASSSPRRSGRRARRRGRARPVHRRRRAPARRRGGIRRRKRRGLRGRARAAAPSARARAAVGR